MRKKLTMVLLLALTFQLFGHTSPFPHTPAFPGVPARADTPGDTDLSPAANVPPNPVAFIKPDWMGPEPDWSDFADESYTIYWQDQDADDNADIALFYDDDQSFANGTLGTIATGIKEDDDEGLSEYVWNTGEIPEGSYIWDTTGVPNGAYYIGATISDEAGGVTSYSRGKVRVYHFAKISTPYDPPGLASVWSDPLTDNPHLIHRHVFFYWDLLEPCGDDNYYWEVNPSSGRYYRDDDEDGVCESHEGPTYNKFKYAFMERLYEKVDPACTWNCEFKQPLELVHPDARVYIQVDGPGPDTLQYNRTTGKYEKKDYWLFDQVALLRTPDGDYNVNGREYPSVQFWAPQYKAYYRDLLQDLATELKRYDEIYPYVSFVRAQLNAFNNESGSPYGSSNNLCHALATMGECADYVYDHENYDPATRYHVSLAKEYYSDTQNQRYYYYKGANDYHEWIAKTYFDIFKNDPDGKLDAEIALKPRPTDRYFTPSPVYSAFLYQVVYEYGAWFYTTSVIATGHSDQGLLTQFVRDKRITRGYTEPRGTYGTQSNPYNIIPARYDNPLQWVYWHALLDLHRGIDVTSFRENVLAGCLPGEDETYCEIFQFLTKYAGRHFSPATSDGAWIAFRPLFHPADLSGNLELHMTQLDADDTSNRLFGYDSCEGDSDCSLKVNLNPPKPSYLNCSRTYCPDDGYFGDVRNGRVVSLGPKSQPYGIWARSIGANGKDTITLDIDDDFVRSLSAGQGVKVNVIYFDRGNDTFTLKYRNRRGDERAIRFNKGNTRSWKGDQASDAVVITDYAFANSLNGGDLELLSNGDGEDIFHMVMLERLGPSDEPDLSQSAKWANYPAPAFGQRITYTIAIRNSGAPFTDTIRLTDTVPAGLAYVPGSLAATLGVPDESARPVLHWSGVLSRTPAVTLTYAVTVTEVEARPISNVVNLDAGTAGLLTRSATIVANGYIIHLPFVARSAIP